MAELYPGQRVKLGWAPEYETDPRVVHYMFQKGVLVNGPFNPPDGRGHKEWVVDTPAHHRHLRVGEQYIIPDDDGDEEDQEIRSVEKEESV